jgi:ribonucleoside-diphosphate reductase alpha chain
VLEGEHLPYTLDYFTEVAKREGFWSDGLTKKIIDNHGSARGMAEVPKKWQKAFTVAHDVSYEWHVRMQAAFQEYTDSAVSKTVNMPNNATVDDVKKAYLLAYDLGCKGITVYRDGSRQEQVMNIGVSEKKEAKKEIVPMTAAGPVVLQPRPRPDVIIGSTQKINTPYGTLYVTINADEKGLFEVFATIGRSGGYTTSFTEAVARLISLALRSGIPVEDVVSQLEGIRSPKVTYDHGERILSVPDALAKALKRQVSGELYKGIQVRMDQYNQKAINGKPELEPEKHIENDSEEHLEDSEEEIVRRGLSPECPQCGMGLSFEEGCVVCHHCGFSEC